LDRWLVEAEAGRLLTAAELCRDRPELLAELEGEIAVLCRFHTLAQASEATPLEGEGKLKTTYEEPVQAVPSSTLLAPGTTFGRYRIIAELGAGGMGIVYHTHDTQLNRDVALKVMRPDVAAKPNTSDRFLHEARAMAAIRHDHVVEVYDYGEMDG